jgi:hypothetical protein
MKSNKNAVNTMKPTISSDSTTTPTNRYPLRSRVTNTTVDTNCNNSSRYPTRNSTSTTTNTNNTRNTKTNTINTYITRNNTNRYPLRSKSINTTTDNNRNNSSRYPTRNNTRTTINTNNTRNTTSAKKSSATITCTKRRINLQSQTTLTPTKLSPDEITRRNLVVRPIVDSLFTKKISNINHRLNRDDYIKILEEYNPHFPWLTKDILKQRIKRKYHRYKKRTSKKNPIL